MEEKVRAVYESFDKNRKIEAAKKEDAKELEAIEKLLKCRCFF